MSLVWLQKRSQSNTFRHIDYEMFSWTTVSLAKNSLHSGSVNNAAHSTTLTTLSVGN